MTQEQKAKAYDKALPKESEDEMIKKALIDFFNRGAENGEQTNGVCDKDILAWLEKQDELVNSLSKGLDNAHERIDELIQLNNKLTEQLEWWVHC